MYSDMTETNNPHSLNRFRAMLEPGQRVRHPGQPDWGDGQVQTVDGARVTVNFAHAGKLLIDARIVSLQVIDP